LDDVKIVKYWGKVPASLMKGSEEEVTSTSDMVEASITIANDAVLLKAVPNPYLFKDRPVIAYQHDTVLESFWGRGIAEKGFNPQKALDAELRARIDAMALTTHPMMAVDAGRVPRGAKLHVRPGKLWLSNGNPRDTFMPLTLGDINPATFSQAGDLERMVQMGTGAMDSSAPIAQNARNQTASGMSMMTSQFVKRNKRSMQNIERNFLSPLVTKAGRRYMQFDPERYPISDYKFRPIASMGIMAREFEQSQLINLMSLIPPDSPVFGVILQGVFENSSLTNKSELLTALQQLMQKEQFEADLQETESKTVKNLADARKHADVNAIEQMKLQLAAFDISERAASKETTTGNK